MVVALPDLQALPGLQQKGGEGSSDWVVAARGSLALDTSDDLEVRGDLSCVPHTLQPMHSGMSMHLEDSSRSKAGRINLALDTSEALEVRCNLRLCGILSYREGRVVEA